MARQRQQPGSPTLAASGGSSTCGDPPEFFGEAYGAPEGTTPLIVVAGSRSTAVACGYDINITSNASDCLLAAQTPTHTEYHFYDGAKASQMRVTRTIGFDASTPVSRTPGCEFGNARAVGDVGRTPLSERSRNGDYHQGGAQLPGRLHFAPRTPTGTSNGSQT